MKETLLENVAPPRFVDGPTMLIANLGERYTSGTSARIPEQWQRLGPYIGHIQGQIGNTAYGVLCNGDDAGKEYIAGVEVADSPRIPQEFSRIRIPEQRYTVFHHAGHISTQFGANGFRSPDVSRPAVPSLNGTVLSLTQ
jgi:AraC family transcriptional regulator